MAIVMWWVYVVLMLACALVGPVGLAVIGAYRLARWWRRNRRNRPVP